MDDIDYSPPAEPLRPLKDIFKADPRHDQVSLESWYDAIHRVMINPSAPRVVKQMFENARMSAVYAYFSYRTHQGFQLLAYAALEKALRMKFKSESASSGESSPRNLAALMDMALDKGWITNRGYKSAYGVARHRAEMKQWIREIESGVDLSAPRTQPEPTEQQIVVELDEMDVARKTLTYGRKARNLLAHGAGGTWMGALGTLEIVAESINQLYQ